MKDFEIENVQFTGIQFYMGTSKLQGKNNQHSLYEFIPQKLKDQKCDMKYDLVNKVLDTISKLVNAYAYIEMLIGKCHGWDNRWVRRLICLENSKLE